MLEERGPMTEAIPNIPSLHYSNHPVGNIPRFHYSSVYSALGGWGAEGEAGGSTRAQSRTIS
jgi:hypothetical protein